MTVTFQLRYPNIPTMIDIDKKQLNSGNITHLMSLKINHKVIIIKTKTPDPKTVISFFTKDIKSSAIIGIPERLISAIFLYFEI
jgi:hypothetical protein